MLLKRNELWSFLHRVVHGMFLALPLSSLEIPRFGTVPLIFRLYLGSRTELLGRERVTKLSMWPPPMLSLLGVLPTLLFPSITWFGDGKALKNSFFFLWRIAKDAFLTNEQHLRRRITNDASCSLCHSGVEEWNVTFVVTSHAL